LGAVNCVIGQVSRPPPPPPGTVIVVIISYTPVHTIRPVVRPVEQKVVCLHDVNGWMLGCMNQTR